MSTLSFQSDPERWSAMPAFDEQLNFLLERRFLDYLDISELETDEDPNQVEWDYREDLRMIRVAGVTHEGEVHEGLHMFNMQNVFSSLLDNGHSLVMAVQGDGERTKAYYGVSRLKGRQSRLHTDSNFEILDKALQSNFHTLRTKALDQQERYDFLAPLNNSDTIGVALTGIPSMRSVTAAGPYVQGLDRFIEAMSDLQYTLLIIAEPIDSHTIAAAIDNCRNLSGEIHTAVKTTRSKTEGTTDSVNFSLFGTAGSSDTETKLGIGSLIAAAGPLLGVGVAGLIASAPVSLPILGISGAIGGAAGTLTNLAAGLPMSISNTLFKAGGGSAGFSRAKSRSIADTHEYLNKAAEYCEQLCNRYEQRLLIGKSLGLWNTGIYLLSDNPSTLFRGSGVLRSVMAGEQTHWEPVRVLNLGAFGQNEKLYMNYLSRLKNPRFELLLHGIEREQVDNIVKRASLLKRMAREAGQTVEQFLKDFTKEDSQRQQIRLKKIEQESYEPDPAEIERAWQAYRSLNLGHPFGEMMAGVSTPMNTEELAIVANLPRREVNGVGVRQAATFGINCPTNSVPDNCLLLGHVVHKGRARDTLPFEINPMQLNKHGFISGVTGSGKTNTCFHILKELQKSKIPFLVIEPAKSEYRQLLGHLDNVRVFTLGREDCSPFRINPFEFQRETGLLTHIDMLKSVFNAAFPMYAAMPYLLEEAIYEVYLDKGWDLSASTNRYIKPADRDSFFDYLPTIEDLLDKIDAVVKAKQYAPEQSLNFSAALKARLSSFMVGSKGLMLNTRRSTPIEDLLSHNVVLELKGIGDDDEKCFLMGLFLTMIYEYREANQTEKTQLAHVTLIEEAHRLLRNVPIHAGMEGANVRGKALETFTNIMAEIRQFGEGLLIVDQIPAKLTPDVIKNSNLKIVHRTLAREDRDAVGETMTLSDVQNCELPLLNVGRVVVHMEGHEKPFMLAVPESKDETNLCITDEIVRKKMKAFHQEHQYVFQRLPGFEKHPDIYRQFSRLDFRPDYPEITAAVTAAATLWCFATPADDSDLKSKVRRLIARNTNTTDELSQDCFFIWYAKRHFAMLNEDWPNRFNFCRAAHAQFIELWFDGCNGGGSIDRQNYITAMRNIVGSANDPLRSMVAWFVNLSDSAHELSRMLNQALEGECFPQTDLFLTAKATEMIMDCKLGKGDFNNLKIQLFSEILKNNPYAETIIREYNSKLDI